MLRLAQVEIGSRRRAQRVDVTVGVQAGQHVDAAGQRLKISAVHQVLLAQFTKEGVTGELVGVEEVFGQRIGLVRGALPGVFVTLQGARRQVTQAASDDPARCVEPRGDPRELVSVEKADQVLVERVGREGGRSLQAAITVAVGVYGGRVTFNQPVDLGARGRVARCIIKPGQPGDVLAEAMPRGKSLAPGVVPTAHVLAWGRQAGAQAVEVQQAVFIESQVGGMDSVKLFLERAARQLYLRVAKQRKFFARRGPGFGRSLSRCLIR